ncbi:hypothetical protein D7X99_36840 [Corallococcus sp. AB032C]|nr:hypothetical protein D7X99_36840 [Corallococcus sp. AB032C]
MGSPGGRACALGREAFQVRDDGLHRAQLRQHVVGVEDGTHVREHLLAQPRRACLPVAAAAVAQVGAVLGQVLLAGAVEARATPGVRPLPQRLRTAIRLADPVAIRLADPATNSLGDPTAIHYPGPSQPLPGL